MKVNALSLLALAAVLAAVGCAGKEETADIPTGGSKENTLAGAPMDLAGLPVTMVAETDKDGNPTRLGFRLETAKLNDLPKDLNMDAPWFDVNGNGKLDMDMMANPPLMETHGDYKVRFDVPATMKDVPFKFLEINWNPMGHPPKPWEVPHLDFHFYISSRDEIDAIKMGPAAFLIGEEEFKKASVPVPPDYVGAGFVDVGAAVGFMGNHLIDPSSPELQPDGPLFTKAWIYGCYDGQITFWEPMITREFLMQKVNVEEPINLPEKYNASGWYPTVWKVLHSDDGYVTVTLEGFVKREAS